MRSMTSIYGKNASGLLDSEFFSVGLKCLFCDLRINNQFLYKTFLYQITVQY